MSIVKEGRRSTDTNMYKQEIGKIVFFGMTTRCFVFRGFVVIRTWQIDIVTHNENFTHMLLHKTFTEQRSD